MSKDYFIDEVFSLALGYHQSGDYRRAKAAYEQVLREQPTHYLSLGNLGLLNLQMSQIDQARYFLNRAVDINPNYSEGYINLGNLYFQQGAYVLAISNYQRVIRLTPDDPEIWTNLGNSYFRIESNSKALVCYLKALSLDPNRDDLHCILGDYYYILSNFTKSIESYQMALTLNPNQPEYYYKIGFAHQQIGQHYKAIRFYQHLLSIEPENSEVHSQLGTAFLLIGDLKNGWMEYEWRRKIEKYARRFSQPFWSGENCTGKTLLIYAEQGIGDTIQFLRFISVLEASNNCNIIFECQESLKTLFDIWLPFSTAVQVVSTSETLPQFDFCLPLMSLPYLLKINSPELIPLVAPLQISSDLFNLDCQAKLKEKTICKIGVVWAGNPDHVRDRYRSIRLNELADLLSIANCTFFSLQVGTARNELFQPLNKHLVELVIDLGQGFIDFADTAKAISQLDMVISVDTAVAHLAASMGKTTWVLLPANPDWRWGLNREDSYWYSSIKVFRQNNLGDWSSVVNSVANELEKKIEKSAKV